MKQAILTVLALVTVYVACQWVLSETPSDPVRPTVRPDAAEAAGPTPGTGGPAWYTLIGWNTLGMHCMNSRFQYLCILPPANTIQAQVILRGDPPRVITTGVRVEYAIDDNTTSVKKTDFWTYANAIFGRQLAPNIGLAGFGLKGQMAAMGDHFEATAVPVTPYNDKMKWNPYQTATLKLKGSAGQLLATTKITVPVSDEIHCEMCHAQYGDAGGFDSPIVEINILRAHDVLNSQFHLEQQALAGQPVLCAQCHADNALNMTGSAGTKSLSEAMHNWHGNLPDKPNCYTCHPGPNTHCNRSAIVGMGRNDATDPGCEKCHGTMANVAQTITDGRRPWLDEPTCASCHGTNHDTGANLYRNATWHSVYCTVCHNSPHAWYPSRLAQDNKQPLQAQGTPYSLGANCMTCHVKQKPGNNPHVTYNFQWP
jgi:hypothetical protein